MNSSRNLRVTQPSASRAMSCFKPLSELISLPRLPDAREMRKTVLYVRCLSEMEAMGLKGSRCKDARTRKRSQRGVLLGDWASLRAEPLMTSLIRLGRLWEPLTCPPPPTVSVW